MKLLYKINLNRSKLNLNKLKINIFAIIITNVKNCFVHILILIDIQLYLMRESQLVKTLIKMLPNYHKIPNLILVFSKKVNSSQVENS